MSNNFDASIGALVGEEMINKLISSTRELEATVEEDTVEPVEEQELKEEETIVEQEGKPKMGDKLELGLKRVADVQAGEEALAEELIFSVQKGEAVTVYCGVDGGSTQTRVALITTDELDSEDDLLTGLINHYNIIPSAYAEVTDSRDIKSNSSLIWDAMDTTISPVGEVGGRKISSPIRIVRGGKKEQVNLPEIKMDSTNQKTSAIPFYVNIIDSLGYAMVEKFKDQCPEHITVNLGVALPPDDLNKRNIELFKQSLLGTYSWSMAGRTILLNIVKVTNLSEPESAIQGMLTLDDNQPPEYVLHIEGGGRSSGVAVLKNGSTLNPTQRTFAYGGSQLIDKLNEAYVNEFGGSPIKARLWEQALNTGLMKSGNSYKDVKDMVLKVKKQFASQIANDIWREVFSQQEEVTPQDINMVTIGGRLFLRGDLEYGVGDYLSAELKRRLPDTKCALITDNFIPFGLLMAALIEDLSEEE